jgi:hypothetical protein
VLSSKLLAATCFATPRPTGPTSAVLAYRPKFSYTRTRYNSVHPSASAPALPRLGHAPAALVHLDHVPAPALVTRRRRLSAHLSPKSAPSRAPGFSAPLNSHSRALQRTVKLALVPSSRLDSAPQARAHCLSSRSPRSSQALATPLNRVPQAAHSPVTRRLLQRPTASSRPPGSSAVWCGPRSPARLTAQCLSREFAPPSRPEATASPTFPVPRSPPPRPRPRPLGHLTCFSTCSSAWATSGTNAARASRPHPGSVTPPRDTAASAPNRQHGAHHRRHHHQVPLGQGARAASRTSAGPSAFFLPHRLHQGARGAACASDFFLDHLVKALGCQKGSQLQVCVTKVAGFLGVLGLFLLSRS